MSDQPFTPVSNGAPSPNQGKNGRFLPGNQAAKGKGNPIHRRVRLLRAAYVRAVTREDMDAIAKAVVTRAKAGDIAAAREVCDRILGKATDTETRQRFERLEQQLGLDAEDDA